MTAPSFSFTVTGATHDDVMREADKVAKAYWGRHTFEMVDVSAYDSTGGGFTADITTQQHMVAAGNSRRFPQTTAVTA